MAWKHTLLFSTVEQQGNSSNLYTLVDYISALMPNKVGFLLAPYIHGAVRTPQLLPDKLDPMRYETALPYTSIQDHLSGKFERKNTI